MTQQSTTPARFISFEGIDGAGKSTHIGFVADLLRQRGVTVLATREPGGTALGEQLRDLLLHQKMHLETEALLMFAYQGGGRGLALDKLDALEQWVHPHLQPDLTLLFDVPLDVARARLDATRELDKFEQEQADFFSATRNEYLRRAAQFPQRFRVIDSTRAIADIQLELAGIVNVLLEAA